MCNFLFSFVATLPPTSDLFDFGVDLGLVVLALATFVVLTLAVFGFVGDLLGLLLTGVAIADKVVIFGAPGVGVKLHIHVLPLYIHALSSSA